MSSKESKKQEKMLAKKVNGRVQVASGALPGLPNDVYNDWFLFEHKYTDAKSYTLKRTDWVSLKKHSDKEGKIPAFVVNFRLEGGEEVVFLRMEEFLDYQRLLIKEIDDGKDAQGLVSEE
jgi:hypothetical protein